MEQEKAEWLQKLRRERGMLLERLKNRLKDSAHKGQPPSTVCSRDQNSMLHGLLNLYFFLASDS